MSLQPTSATTADLNVSGNISASKYFLNGTSLTDYLEVCTLRTKKLTVESGWCDFVFASDYKRMNWKEKQLYYLTHKRLPYMVSAGEIEEKGLDISESMKGMVRNIEEDRLDITELFERMEKVEKENTQLRQDNVQLKKDLVELEKQVEK